MARADMGAGRAPARSPETSMGWGTGMGTGWDPLGPGSPPPGPHELFSHENSMLLPPPPVSK